MSKKTNIQKVHKILGGDMDKFSDNSSSWVSLEDHDTEICISFTGDGKTFTDISVSKKIWDVVDEPIIARIIK